ncbi:MAG: hypothetical protein LAT64_06935 [Phycisphaerales bacterium]|nr:hypothetical protein [Planctomycetota bacterium]MCH8508489.1 hypothetical protein [Phycisphaerales bacterium]
MNKQFLTVAFGASALGFLAGGASAELTGQHIGLNAVDGRLVTERWLSGTGFLGEEQVFTRQFGMANDDPGTNSFGGTFETPGAIGFNILSGLQVWRGVDSGFSATDGETMTISFGPASATTGSGFVAGYSTAVRDENTHPTNSAQWGRHHTHNLFTLNNNGASGEGLFLLNLEWYYEAGPGNDTSLANSKPMWILFDFTAGGDTQELILAANWAREFVVPAPGGAAVLALAGLGLARRRR